MSQSEGVSIRPGISEREMHDIWEEAIQTARDMPGRTVTLFLAAGSYPIPDHGEYEYRPTPTMLTVPEPGVEVRFRHNRQTGVTQIDTIAMQTQGEIA